MIPTVVGSNAARCARLNLRDLCDPCLLLCEKPLLSRGDQGATAARHAVRSRDFAGAFEQQRLCRVKGGEVSLPPSDTWDKCLARHRIRQAPRA